MAKRKAKKKRRGVRPGRALVVLYGNLVSDPKIYKNHKGRVFVPFVLGVSLYQYKRYHYEYPKCVAWGGHAERLAQWGAKGQRVYLEGYLHRSIHNPTTAGGRRRLGPMEVVVTWMILEGGLGDPRPLVVSESSADAVEPFEGWEQSAERDAEDMFDREEMEWEGQPEE